MRRTAMSRLRFDQVRVPVGNLVHAEGSGFEIAQARLGPGRIHHCMRLIGLAQRALEAMVERARNRVAFGQPLGAHGMVQEMIVASRCEIDQARLLTLQAAAALDAHGNKGARDRDRHDQDRRTAHGLRRDRSRDPAAWRRRPVAGPLPRRMRMPLRARCAWRTVPMKCISRRSRVRC